MPPRQRFRFSNLGITQGALIILGLEVGLSLVYLLADVSARATLESWLVATPSHVFEHGRVWTLVTSNFLEPDLIGLLLQGFMMFMFVPTLERFWGTTRFFRFVAITSLVGTAVGVVVGQLLGREVPIFGLSPFTWAAVVAFGVIYARQPVQFFGVLPLTGRQFMLGFIVFLMAFVLLQQKWEQGAGFAAAMITAAVMTSKRWSPALAWRRWKIARARAKLTVMQGGKPAPKRDEQKYLN